MSFQKETILNFMQFGAITVKKRYENSRKCFKKCAYSKHFHSKLAGVVLWISGKTLQKESRKYPVTPKRILKMDERGELPCVGYNKLFYELRCHTRISYQIHRLSSWLLEIMFSPMLYQHICFLYIQGVCYINTFVFVYRVSKKCVYFFKSLQFFSQKK